ncbi:uncharacterized protein LOC130699977 [Daphnia carinata]|uniref:uncharacterized protein LOC130699977 n=1 Tax=Daphnia carinata TaxID=120202 RepID=UPI00257DF4D5|nr:uncharacterized protein LOC130699977 [Daphnia carinata]
MTTTIAPLLYSTTIAPSYVTAGPSYNVVEAGPAYAAPQMPVPIPLTPMVMMPEHLLVEEETNEFGIGKLLKKVIALPLAIVLPITIPLILIIKYLLAGQGLANKPFISGGAFGTQVPVAPELVQTTPFFTTTPMPNAYAGPQNYGSAPQGYGGAPQGAPPGYGGSAQDNQSGPDGWNRRRREANETSSGFPSMSLAQIEKLTQVVFAAMRSQECIQRLVCELGSMSKSFSDTAHTVTAAVESFVPESIKESYDVFVKAEKCEQYVCGSLAVKK